MMKKYNINEALVLLNDYILFSKESEILFFCLNNDTIIVFNDKLKIAFSKKDFINNFKDSTFFIHREINTEKQNDEIYQDDKKYRQ